MVSRTGRAEKCPRSPLRRTLPGLIAVLAAVVALLVITAWPVLSSLLHPGGLYGHGSSQLGAVPPQRQPMRL